MGPLQSQKSPEWSGFVVPRESELAVTLSYLAMWVACRLKWAL